ncbi:hypothetical protein BDD43_3802 [Mucilaginibacter gracilis]|uniref:Parallel beta helix pectate lyase-like protein n=1 Tax=Mucilaginibacter gracilis TaxID=423350 RepID=A0A495J4R3_9SPHI|nr:hypothetical protein [Mucilaginibacter gracilis]RKR83592.1 hypothetical protein BDD43_3802 [Mucilaginibacter gracilis]
MKKIFKQLLVVLCGALALSACHQKEITNISPALIQTANAITSDTLKGTIKGTLLSGKTYYFSSDITVNDGDTLLLQSGVHLIALCDGKTPATAPEIFMHGTFISLGTKDQPNYITVKNADDLHAQAAQQNYVNVFFGWWGGITCTPSAVTPTNPNPKGGDAIIKWTHIEFGGGPAGSADNQAFYATGNARYNIYFANITKNLIIEDSWFFGAKDDNIRTDGGKISIMRNTFELCGGVGGEFLNMKSGTVGDVAYNMCIGSATNSLKLSDAGSTGVQANVNMYNNTMVNGGYRQTKTGRGGAIDYEKLAKGKAFNNLFVNCRFSMRVTSDADIANVSYNNNLFYGYSTAIVGQFYTTDSYLGIPKGSSDIISTTVQTNNPLFYGYDVNQYNFTSNPGPISASLQPFVVVAMGAANFRLTAASPAIGKGNTSLLPLNTVTATGTYGATITPPGRDLGAYQSDGTGNQH